MHTALAVLNGELILIIPPNKSLPSEIFQYHTHLLLRRVDNGVQANLRVKHILVGIVNAGKALNFTPSSLGI